MFEHKRQKLLPTNRFIGRILVFAVCACAIVAFGLCWGILGYHYICKLGWIDALLNAAMILTGMGPVNAMESDSAKVFASIYALFSGIVFLSSIGIVLTPIMHRVMHTIHLDDAET